jgi:hypothetical protein
MARYFVGRRDYMGQIDDFEERRKHERFYCKNCAVTVDFKACPIVNISMGGFAFTYSNLEDWQENQIEKAILFGDNICLEKVSFQTVCDYLVTENTPVLLESRIRGVRFNALTPDQRMSLKSFISHLAEPTAASAV